MTFSIVSASQPFSEHSLAADVVLGIEDAHPRKAAPLLREAQKLVEKLVIVGKNGLIVSRLFCAYRIGTPYHFNERSRSPVRCLLFISPILRTENRVPDSVTELCLACPGLRAHFHVSREKLVHAKRNEDPEMGNLRSLPSESCYFYESSSYS